MIDTLWGWLWTSFEIVLIGAWVATWIWFVWAIIEDINELRELWRNKK